MGVGVQEYGGSVRIMEYGGPLPMAGTIVRECNTHI